MFLIFQEDRRRPYPVLNLSESAISKLVEKAGDLTKANKKGGGVMGGDDAVQGLLDGQGTPTLYDVQTGPIVVEESLPRGRRTSRDGGDRARSMSGSVNP